MARSSRRSLFLIVIVLGLFGLLGMLFAQKISPGASPSSDSDIRESVKQFTQVYETIEQNYADKNNVPYGLVKNKAGKFLKPIHSTIEAAVAASTKTTPATLAQSLIYASGKNSYPIINFEYLMVQKQQSSAAVAEAIRTFLAWASSPTGGATSDNLSAVDFVALPTSVIPKVDAAIAKITG